MKTIDKEKNNDWIFINQWNGSCLTAEVGAERGWENWWWEIVSNTLIS